MVSIPAKIIRISTDDLPQNDPMGALCDLYGRTIIKHDIVPFGDQPFRFDATLLSMPALGLASSVIGACRAPRGARHIDGDDLVLTISLSGGRIVEQRGREAIIREGEAVLTSSADPGAVTIPALTRHVSLRIPRATLAPTITDADACLVRPIAADNPALVLLTAYVTALPIDGAQEPPVDEDVVAHIHDLVALTLGATRDEAALAERRGARAARLSAIKRDILDNLGNPALSVAQVAGRHRITPRYVHMLFEREGATFTAFVVEHRLARAYRMLSDPRYLGYKIRAISDDCGFKDLSWFNRTFRRHYGATPSDVRGGALKNVR